MVTPTSTFVIIILKLSNYVVYTFEKLFIHLRIREGVLQGEEIKRAGQADRLLVYWFTSHTPTIARPGGAQALQPSPGAFSVAAS